MKVTQAIRQVEPGETPEGIGEYPAGLDSIEATVELPHDPHVNASSKIVDKPQLLDFISVLGEVDSREKLL